MWEVALTPSVLDRQYYVGLVTVPWNRRIINLRNSDYGGDEIEKYEWVQPAWSKEGQKVALLLNTDMALAWKVS